MELTCSYSGPLLQFIVERDEKVTQKRSNYKKISRNKERCLLPLNIYLEGETKAMRPLLEL